MSKPAVFAPISEILRAYWRSDRWTLLLVAVVVFLSSVASVAIRRFSEDIDLSFDRTDLGYTSDRDPEKEGISKKKAE